MNQSNKVYPISEIFVNFQGEGVYTGVVMCFIRLAGCTVGKPYPKEYYDTKGHVVNHNVFPIYTEKCTLYDGREFPCDTDYRVKERLTAEQIVERIPANVTRVCITGGEPLMHDLSELLTGIRKAGKHIHIETSGTRNFADTNIWITVAPKKGCTGFMISTCDELKFLVDEHFNPEALIPDTLERIDKLAERKPVYLHPVNGEHEVDANNLKLCRKWQTKYPQFRVGIQLHKAISHYTKEVER